MKPDGDSNESAASVRADVLFLLRQRRYEDALAALYRARAESPASLELQKSIDQIKEFLVGAYAKRLGGLDQVATPFPPGTQRSPDLVLLSRFIDGRATFGDVAQMSPLGQLRTLQLLSAVSARDDSPRESERDAPRSGLRGPPQAAARMAPADEGDSDDGPPETARSPSAVPPEPINQEPIDPATLEDARRYRELFALGTAAFVQHRYADAVEAFEGCAALRPGDSAALVMLRRSKRDLESR